MRPAGLAEAPYQDVVRCLQKKHRGIELFLQRAQDGRKLLELLALANVRYQGGLFNLRRLLDQFGKAGNQVNGKVVRAIVAQVFKSHQDGSLPRAGHAGNHYQMVRTLVRTSARFRGSGHKTDTTTKRRKFDLTAPDMRPSPGDAAKTASPTRCSAIYFIFQDSPPRVI